MTTFTASVRPLEVRSVRFLGHYVEVGLQLLQYLPAAERGERRCTVVDRAILRHRGTTVLRRWRERGVR
jgi:hypothetical protein